MIKVGVIGLGAMGGNHVRVYSELPDVAPVGIADADHGMTQGLAKRYRTKPFSEPLKLELEAFIHSLKNNIPPPISGEDGLKALEVASLCLQGKS